MKLLVRSAALTGYFDVARELGFNPTPALRQAGLTRAVLRDPEQRIPASAVIELLEQSAALSDCASYGLRMAELRQLSDFGIVSLLITQQRTLREAIETLIRYRRLINDALAIQLEDAGRSVILREELAAGRATRQGTELAMGVLARMCGSLLAERWKPQAVRFTHEAPVDLETHRRVFRCKLEFGADFNGFVCAASDLDAPNPKADAAMARYAQHFIETLPETGASSLEQEVRRAILLGLPGGTAGIGPVAQGLGLSVRTLQRQLDAAGVQFSALLNEVRRELVLRYLPSPRHSLGHIAELLGYATPAAFTRWFIAQFGMSPQAWRRAQPPAAQRRKAAA